MTPQKVHNVALIGCGRIGRVHASAVSTKSGLNLTAVCDIVDERKTALAGEFEARGYDSHTDLLKKEKVDLVVVATPNGTHYQIAKDAFNARRNVLLEKPITITDEDALDLIEIARRQKVRFFAVKQVRYNPAVQVTKLALEENRLGKLFSAALVVRWTRPQEYYDSSDWRGTKQLDGGSLLNQGIHYVDLMQWFLGDVESVFGRKDTLCHDIEIEDLAFGLVQFKSGAVGTVEFTVNTYPHNLECSLTLLGSQGSVKLAGSAMNVVEQWEVKDIPKPYVQEGFAPLVYAGGLYQGSCPNHVYVYDDILKSFRGDESNFVNGAEAYRSLHIVNSLYRSAEENKEIAL